MLVERITEDKGTKCCKKRYESDVAHCWSRQDLGCWEDRCQREVGVKCTDGYRHFREICQLSCKYSQNGHRSEIMRCGAGQLIIRQKDFGDKRSRRKGAIP